MTLDSAPPLLNAKQAAALLGISHDVVLDAMHSGQLPTVMLRKRLYVSTPRLRALLESGESLPQVVGKPRQPRKAAQPAQAMSFAERVRAAR